MSEFCVSPEAIATSIRKDGISAILRVRNGDEFLRFAIESHLPYFDEIVAVHNQCNDNSVKILESFATRYPDQVKVFEYLPRVYPPGSHGHRRVGPESVHSLANYYNFALSKTTRKIVTKLDDDHVAIEKNLARVTNLIRRKGIRNRLLCYSGVNLMRCSDSKRIGVYSNRPFVGNGDHWFLPVSSETYFTKDDRFETLRFGSLKVEYVGIMYFHLKFLKKGFGFDNYEFCENPDSRYIHMLRAFKTEAQCQSLHDFIVERSKRLDLYPTTNLKLQAVAKLPISILRLFRNTKMIKGNIALARAIRVRSDLSDVCLPKDIL